MAELYLLDADFKTTSEIYYGEAQKVEELVQKYVATLQGIVEEKILEGDAGTILLNFATLAQEALKGEVDTILFDHKTKTTTFVAQTETDDEAEIG